MELVLKKYQTEALATLEAFFDRGRGATQAEQIAAAFEEARRVGLGEAAPPVPYRPLRDGAEIPQICFRIPTGGGKTLLAAHAIERAARLYVGTKAPLALWLVPSNTIRTQTLEALKKGYPTIMLSSLIRTFTPRAGRFPAAILLRSISIPCRASSSRRYAAKRPPAPSQSIKWTKYVTG